MYGEGIRGMGQEPAFMVVKKNEASESAQDEPITDVNVKEWEVRSTQLKHSCSHGSKCCVVPSPIDGLSIVLCYGLIHNLWNMFLFCGSHLSFVL